jgi:dynein light chain LC8-type
MDPASEELQRRSRYLSALVRRTKLADADMSQPEPAVVEAKAELKAPRAHVGGEGKGGKEEERTPAGRLRGAAGGRTPSRRRCSRRPERQRGRSCSSRSGR